MRDYRFALGAEAACPAEVAAWEAASREAVGLLFQFIDGAPGVAAVDVLEAHVREVYARSKARTAYEALEAQEISVSPGF